MAQYAQLPDGSHVEFPDDWNEQQMDEAVYRDFADQFPDRQPAEASTDLKALPREVVGGTLAAHEAVADKVFSAGKGAVDLIKQAFSEASSPELDAISGAQPTVATGADLPGAAAKMGAQPTALDALGEMGSQFMGSIKTVPSNILDFALSGGEAVRDLMPEPKVGPERPEDQSFLSDAYALSHTAGGKMADALREGLVTPVLESAKEQTAEGSQMAAKLPPGDIKRGLITGAGSAGHTVAALLGGYKNALKIMFGDVGGMETRKAKELMDNPDAGPLTKGLRAAGFDEAGALIIGSMYGGAEIVGEKTALGLLFKKWGKNWVKDLVKFGVVETGQEGLTETLQAGLDKITSDPNMTFGEFTDRYKDLLASLPVAIGGPTIATKGVQYTANRTNEEMAERDFNRRVDEALSNIASDRATSAFSPDNAQLTSNPDAAPTIDPKYTTQQPEDVGPAASGATAKTEELDQAQKAYTKAEAAEQAEVLGGKASGAQQLTEDEARDEQTRILADREKEVKRKEVLVEADIAHQKRMADIEKEKAGALPDAKIQQAKQDTKEQNRVAEEKRVQADAVKKGNEPADSKPTTMEQQFQKVLDEELIAELKKTLPKQKALPYKPTIPMTGDKAEKKAPVKLVHYSKKEGLTEIDPTFHGKGVSGQESKRKASDPTNWVDRSYFYMDQETTEHKDVMLGEERYEVDMDADKIYDAKADPDGIKEASRFGPSLNLSLYEKNIKEAGYAGYWTDTPEQGKVAAMFERVPTTPTTKAVADQIKENGGYSVNPKTNAAPTDGYMVSNRPELEKQIPLSEFTQADVDQYMQDNADALEEDGAHFGAWVENGDTVVLDISQQYASEREAAVAAIEYDQRAIYDVKADKETLTSDLVPESLKKQSPLEKDPDFVADTTDQNKDAFTLDPRKNDTGFGTLHSNPISAMRKEWEKTAQSGIDMWNNAVGWRYDTLGKLPSKDLYLKERYKVLGRIADVDTIAKDIYSTFRNASADDQRAVYDYLTTPAATPNIIEDAGVRAKAVSVKKLINKTGQALVDKGLLSEKAFLKNQDGYLPRTYLKYLLGDSVTKALMGGKKVSRMAWAKARKEIPAEVRELILGEITDPAYLASKGLGTELRDIVIIDFLDWISEKQQWSQKGSMLEWEGRNVSTVWLDQEARQLEKQAAYYEEGPRQRTLDIVADMDARRAVAEEILNRGDAEVSTESKDYRQVPVNKRYGRLQGAYIRKEIYDDLLATGQIMPADSDPWESWFGYGGKGTKVTQLWKMSKVALNPPAQIRNAASNMILLHLSGIPVAMVPVYIARAARDMRTNGRYYRLAKKHGVTESTFAAQELFRIERDLLDLEARLAGKISLATFKNIGGIIGETAGDAYQIIEALGKTAKIMHAMETQGMNSDDAAMEAQKWLFDYSLVPKVVRTARNMPLGVPFITFYYKVLPRLLETAIKRPWAYAPYIAIPQIFAMIFAEVNDVDDEDARQLMKAFPTWLQNRGNAFLYPAKDAEGRWQPVDFSYILPWSMFVESARNAGEGDFTEAVKSSGIFGGPIPSIATAIKTNRDPYTDRNIVTPGSNPKDQVMSMLAYTYQLAMPTFLTNQGFAGKMLDAINEDIVTNEEMGRTVLTPGQATLRLFGVNVYPMNPERTRGKNIERMQKQIEEIKMDARRRRRDAVSDRGDPAQKLEAINTDAEKRIQKIAEKIEKYAEGSEVPEALTLDR